MLIFSRPSRTTDRQCKYLHEPKDMANVSSSEFKQQILNDFNNRSNYENEFHKKAATQLVERVNLQTGQRVLDIATGTGLAAIAAAKIIGPTGHVLATDFATGMLKQAQKKAETLGLTNITFETADADIQELQANHYDVVLCSSAIVYFTDIPASLRRWQKALKPGGTVAFSCLAETSPSASALFRAVVKRYGITIPNPNALLGTPERCRTILTASGFEGMDIETKQLGSHTKDATAAWVGNAKSAFGLQGAQWSEEKLNRCKQEFLAEIEKASTAEGYWSDITMFFVTASKVSEGT